jgi:F-type H+-transporting ATPase subunit b
MNFRLYALPIFCLLGVVAHASGGEHHSEGIPTQVYWQAANVAIILIGGYFLLGKKIVETFSSRKSIFLADFEKSQAIQKEAERKLSEIKHRLARLEDSAEESIERARAEAADLRRQLKQESVSLAEKIKSEADLAVKAEIQAAKRALIEEVANESIRQARVLLKKDVGQADQQRLQDGFAKQLEGVRL